MMTLGDMHAMIGRIIEDRPAAALNVVAVRLQTAEGPADLHVEDVEVENRLGAAFLVAPAEGLMLVEAPLQCDALPPTTTTDKG